jgi:hypothetical protein
MEAACWPIAAYAVVNSHTGLELSTTTGRCFQHERIVPHRPMLGTSSSSAPTSPHASADDRTNPTEDRRSLLWTYSTNPYTRSLMRVQRTAMNANVDGQGAKHNDDSEPRSRPSVEPTKYKYLGPTFAVLSFRSGGCCWPALCCRWGAPNQQRPRNKPRGLHHLFSRTIRLDAAPFSLFPIPAAQ